MNYFAHAVPFLDEPYVVAGTGVPDWLSVVDRRCRVRLRDAQRWAGQAEGPMRAVARGLVQHMLDDARFHGTRAFVELRLEFSADCRRHLGQQQGHGASFLGHWLIEVLLDAHLIAADPGRLDAYYEALGHIEPAVVQAAVNRMAARPTEALGATIAAFRRQRILWDYLDDAKLLGRLNQVLWRVGLARVPESFVGLLPAARRKVARRSDALLAGLPRWPGH
ncbi:MAG TPA: hypothetical protein EYP56_05855 [Planctomycetaceae bacterium]|nr:hypothetical protein [Planctomycetaceae bacterium]